MKKVFLEKFFSPAMEANLLKAITNAEQGEDELFHEFWEQFERAVVACPFHNLSKTKLLLHFNSGLNREDGRLLAAACNGGILNLSPDATRSIIEQLAENSRNTLRRDSGRRIHAGGSSNSILESQESELASMFKNFITTSVGGKAKVCQICHSIRHPTDGYTQLQEDTNEEVKAMGYQGNTSNQKYDPHSSTYNPGWKNHLNFRWRNDNDNRGIFQKQNQDSNFEPSAHDLIKMLAAENMKLNGHVTEIGTSINKLTEHMNTINVRVDRVERQISQIATSVSRLEAEVLISCHHSLNRILTIMFVWIPNVRDQRMEAQVTDKQIVRYTA